MALHIRLLGELDLRDGAERLPPFESARAESLLAYLLLHRDAPQPRQRIAFLLWPDSGESQARTNLRHVLHNLRRELPDAERFLDVTPRTLQWRADAPFWLDVAEFEAAIARAERGTGDEAVAALREAVELYAGDLLEGCYDEWLLEEREHLRGRYLDVLERLATLLAARGEAGAAIDYAERLLRHDPLHEATYRLLMRQHDACGDRARAMRVYHVCSATLERELGVEPSAATRADYEALLRAVPAEQGAEPVPKQQQPQAARLVAHPLVGRATERSRLAELWRAAEDGRAQLALVTGEPGAGKTRLVEEFRAWCAQRGAISAEARSYAAEGALAYGPVVAWLRSEALKARVERLDRARLTELTRLLPELRTEIPDLAHAESQQQPLSESDQRQRLFDALARAILMAGGPLLLVADDLHWSDRETLQFLHYLLRVEPGARLLVVATARREELGPEHPLHDLLTGLQAMERATEIDIGRLTRVETAALAGQIAGTQLPDVEAERLYAETEGNPLFVVEALRAGWLNGDGTGGWMSPKVQAVIQARLAQLSEPARELVGIAATMGREFTSDVLARASEAGEDALVRGLDELWRRRIIREQGRDGYDFSHDKIREVAYLALSPARRRHEHLRIARALEQRHAGDLGSVSGQLASHYELAGSTEQAVPWYARAAELAQQLHANSEAARLLWQAIDLLRTLPETDVRRARELALLTALPGPLLAIEGYHSSRLREVHERALALARALGTELDAPLLRSLAVASLSRDDFEAAQRFGEQLQARGERDADNVLLVQSEYVLGIAAFWQGQFDVARMHFEAGVQRYRAEDHRAHLLGYGHNPKVICLMRLGHTLCFLGRIEAGALARDAALALAEEIQHPYSVAVARVFAALMALELRDSEGLREYVAQLWASHREGKAASHIEHGIHAFDGYLNVLDGRTEGIARIQRVLDILGIAQPEAPGEYVFILRVLLAACAATGDAQAALAVADRMLLRGALTGARVWDAEAHRLRAESLAALGAPHDDIETALARAFGSARRQGARLFELRAAASLLRLRRERGDESGAREAHDLLTAILAKMPEGREMPDLREAQALPAEPS